MVMVTQEIVLEKAVLLAEQWTLFRCVLIFLAAMVISMISHDDDGDFIDFTLVD